MGYGDYSQEAHEAMTAARSRAPVEAVFRGNACDPAMNPLGVTVRQCRDSAAHPETTGIVFALDVSGSMGTIPYELATRTLPSFMRCVHGLLPGPNLMFTAFGNAYSDRSPLQVGQFESEAALIDRWLSALHLEGAGGGLGESYDLAMYFAARHTALDCWERRGHKGWFFMTGDEVPFVELAPHHVRNLIGDGLERALQAHEVVAELQERYHVFFLIPDAQRAAAFDCGAVWRMLLHERCLVLESTEDAALVCAACIGIEERLLPDRAAIEGWLERQGRTGEARDRVVRVVLPFAQALARGPIAPPQALFRRAVEPNVRG